MDINTIIGAGSATLSVVQSMTGLDEKMQILQKKMEILKSREADLIEEIEYAESRLGNKRKREVDTWMTHLQSLKDEFQSLKSQVEERRLITRANLVSRVNQFIKEAEELERQGKFPRGPTQILKDNVPFEIPTAELVGNAFEEHCNKVLSCLMNNEVSSIGIYGMGGVGKTTLAANIHNHLLNERTSDVCWITVSQDCKTETLQLNIAKCYHLDLSNEDGTAKRAAKLFHFLQRKKPVMILDDVWSSFNLKEVGIPMGLSGCNLILTTRSLNICRQMGCQQLIKVEKLSEDEAWHLFMRNLGHHVVFPNDVEQIVRSVAKECAGLPLGIVVVSGSMRGVEDIHEWRNALEGLKSANFSQEFMEEKVFGVLRYSYTRLSDPTLQQCFLHVASYPEDKEISRDRLVQFFVNAGLIGKMNSRRAELDRAHSIVTKLVNVCLLESIQKTYYMKMHDLVRDMAINMMGSRFMVKAGLSLREVPEESEWTESLEKVSLMNNSSLVEIPTEMSPKCPRLRMLSLAYTAVADIGDSFFHFMPALEVLDLSDARVATLPSSISNLENLTALLLCQCRRLSSVPSLAKLKALKTLDLSDSGLRIAPEGMESLVSLKCLDVTGSKLESLPPEVLPKLSQLQYLRLNSEKCHLRVQASELMSLRKLETLECTFLNFEEFDEYVRYLQQHQGPTSWHLGLGDIPAHTYARPTGFNCGYSKVVTISPHTREKSLHLPGDTEFLYIIDCAVGLRTLMDLPSFGSTSNLKGCKIWSCESLEDVVRLSSSSAPSSSHHDPLQTLEDLHLEGLKNLRGIIQVEGDRAIIPRVLSESNIFCQLKRLVISWCKKIKKLLAYEFLPVLVNLEYLMVSWCIEMDELFPVTDGENEAMESGEAVTPMVSTLPKLKRLCLWCLPALRSICSRRIDCDSLRELTVFQCPLLKEIPLRLRIPHNGEPSDGATSDLHILINDDNEERGKSVEFAGPVDRSTLEQYVRYRR